MTMTIVSSTHKQGAYHRGADSSKADQGDEGEEEAEGAHHDEETAAE